MTHADDLTIWAAVDRLSVQWAMSHRKVKQSVRPRVRDRVCTTCDAKAKDPCTTSSGEHARTEHMPRWVAWSRSVIEVTS